MGAAEKDSSENSVEKADEAEMSEESGKAEEKSDEFQEKSEKSDKFNEESEMKEESGKEESSSGDVPMKESEKDAEQNLEAESKSGGSEEAPGSGPQPAADDNNKEMSNIDSGGSSSDMPQEDAGTAEKQANDGRRKALMADNLMRQAEMEADEDESAIREEDDARKKSMEQESEEVRDNAAKAEEWKKDYMAKITRQKQELEAADKAEAEQEKAAADTKGGASSKEKSLSPNVIDEFADIAKDMHDSKSGNVAVSTAADAKPKAKGVDESSADAAAGDADQSGQAEAGQAAPESEVSGEAASAGSGDGASKAKNSEGGVKQLGRIDRDFRSLHQILQRLNRRQRDRRMQSPLAVGAQVPAAPAQAPAARAVVNALMGSSGGSKKASPALIEADAREDDEDTEMRADADAAAAGGAAGAAGAKPAKPTWADKLIDEMKPKIEELKADKKGMRAKINEAMKDLIDGDCKPADPVSCFVKALTGKTTKQHFDEDKDTNKPFPAEAEPKIAEWLWEHFKYQLMHALSSSKTKDQAAGVELMEELREWADKFGAPFEKANNCTELPASLVDLWKCVKCTRINGSSIWSLDSTTSYRICIKTPHNQKDEAAHCEKDILELKKNTTLFLNCLHGVSYRAMLATNKLRGFVEKLLKKLAEVVKDLEEDRGNSVYRLLKGRKIGDDDGKCSKPPAYLKPIDKKCLFCQDKMWIMKDEAKFTTCNIKDSGFVCGPVCIYTIVSVTIAVILIILIIALVLVPMCKKKGGGGDDANANANENSNAKKFQLVAKDSRGSYERLAPAAE